MQRKITKNESQININFFDILPQDILKIILLSLDLQSSLVARLVCMRWLLIIKLPQEINDEIIDNKKNLKTIAAIDAVIEKLNNMKPAKNILWRIKKIFLHPSDEMLQSINEIKKQFVFVENFNLDFLKINKTTSLTQLEHAIANDIQTFSQLKKVMFDLQVIKKEQIEIKERLLILAKAIDHPYYNAAVEKENSRQFSNMKMYVKYQCGFWRNFYGLENDSTHAADKNLNIASTSYRQKSNTL